MDLVYSQYDTLYDLIPNSLRPTNDPSILALEPHADGTIGLVSTPSSSTTPGNKKSSTSRLATISNVSNAKLAPPSGQSSEVNLVESSHQSGGKKKNTNNKGKVKKYSIEQEITKTPEPTIVGSKQKKKEKYPCMICVKDNYTKYFPHIDEITWFLKVNSQPMVLKDPFPLQQ